MARDATMGDIPPAETLPNVSMMDERWFVVNTSAIVIPFRSSSSFLPKSSSPSSRELFRSSIPIDDG